MRNVIDIFFERPGSVRTVDGAVPTIPQSRLSFADFYRRGVVIYLVLAFFCNLAVYLNLFMLPRVIPLYWILLACGLVAVSLMMDRQRIEFVKMPLFNWIVCFLIITEAWFFLIPGSDGHILKKRVLSCAVMCIFLCLFSRDWRLMQFTRWLLVAAVLVAVACNVVDFLVPYLFVPRGSDLSNPGRAAGFYVNANQAGSAIIFGMLLGTSVLRPAWRVPFVGCALIGILVTFSRSAILGWAVAAFMLLCLRQFRLKHVGMVLVAVGAVVAALWAGLGHLYHHDGGLLDRLGWFVHPVRDMNASAIVRLDVARKAWHMFLWHPWLGNGIGSTDVWSLPDSTHNMYLLYMADYGIIGLLLFLTLVVVIIYGAGKLVRPTAWPFAVFLLFMAFFSHNIVDNYFALFAMSLMASVVCVERASAVRPGLWQPAHADVTEKSRP